MPGFENNIFINLSKSLERHLICSICLNIYKNAIRTQCEHTFCKSCLQDWIENNNKNCPECRTGFTLRKRTTSLATDLNLVIVHNFIFRYNLITNNIINELKVKCVHHSNGCQEAIDLGLLSVHLKYCEYRLCPKCELVAISEGHDCIERMKTDRNHLRKELNEIKVENSLLEEEIKRIKNNNNEWNQKLNDMKDVYKRLEEELNNKTNEFEAQKSLLEEENRSTKHLNNKLKEKLADLKDKIKELNQQLNICPKSYINDIRMKIKVQNSKN